MGVYNFSFSGALSTNCTFPPPVSSVCNLADTFSLSFLANSPAIPLAPNQDYFSASLNAYDVNVALNGTTVMQSGTGTFSFEGPDAGSFPQGPYFGGFQFTNTAFSFGGSADFDLGRTSDALNGAGFLSDDDVSSCTSAVGSNAFCFVQGTSARASGPSAVPEPSVAALLILGVATLVVSYVVGRRRSNDRSWFHR